MHVIDLSYRRLLRSFRKSEEVGLVLLAVSVGLAGGAGAIGFRYLIRATHQVFVSGGAHVLPFLGDYGVILLPAVGLFVVSLIVNRWAPEAQGHGIPEVVYAIRRQRSRIRLRVVAVKAMASAICIGSGGSVGREGPIVQIGSTIGSAAGQLLGLRERRVRLLIACGAAAGIGGTFNAPIAGVIFALEVILGNFAARSFGLVVISSVTATALCQAVLGSETAFALAQVFTLQSPFELPIYGVLGLLTGLLALAYVQSVDLFERAFEHWRLHYAMRAFIGGAAVGVIGFVSVRYLGGDYLFGVGYGGIEAALRLDSPSGLHWALGAGMTVTALVLLCVLKIVATSMTLAAGGSGGVFAPALFIGAMAGGAFGLVVNALFPGITAPAGAYALVGMGAVFAGSAHAPITSILILFEMTGDYEIILPLMIAVVISLLVASWLNEDSVYSIKLRRRGALTLHKPQTSALDLFLVADVMTTEVPSVAPDMPLEELTARFHRGHARSFPVVDDEGRLVGIVSEYDVESALMSGTEDARAASDIMTRNLITCTRRRPLRDVLQTFTNQDVGQIPVVADDDPTELIGMLRREEILWAYGELVTEHRRMLNDNGLELGESAADAVQLEVQVKPEHEQLCFKKLRDLNVPERCLVAFMRRADRAIVPRGETVIEAGDVLILLTTEDYEARLREWVERVTHAGAEARS